MMNVKYLIGSYASYQGKKTKRIKGLKTHIPSYNQSGTPLYIVPDIADFVMRYDCCDLGPDI